MKILETGSAKRKKLFTLILTSNRFWGSILLPYIINDESNKGYYRLSECLTPFPYSETLSTLTAEEREVVKIINEYTERNLFRLFSKDRNVKEFLEKITAEKINEFIRPYIERRIYKCLIIARDENIPVCYQKTKTSTLHSEDRLRLAAENAIPVFKFQRNEEQTNYNLSLESGGKIINLRKNPVDIICMSPCIIKEDHKVHFVSDVDGSKLRPFLTKESIIIPKKTEEKYFRGFVLNAVNNFKVENHGFDITYEDPAKQALLEIEEGFSGVPCLILKYLYNNNSIYANDTAQSFTIFEQNDGRFGFRKFRRDFVWEKRCYEILGELGFFSDDDIHFIPFDPDIKKKEELYSFLESLNSCYDDLINAGFLLTSKLDQNYNLKSTSIEMSSQMINDWFDLKAKVKLGEFEIPFNFLKKNILGGIREYVLPDGSIAILPEAWFTRYKNIFEFGKCTEDTLRVHKQHFSLLPGTIDKEETRSLRKLEKLLDPEKIAAIAQPSGINGVLRQYQSEGLNWLVFLQAANLGGCLADDMGLGKTLQTLALLQHNRENIAANHTGRSSEPTLFEKSELKLTSLLIVPASLIYNWVNEITRFVPGMRICSYKGNMRKKSTDYFHNFDIIISSYHTIRQDIDLIKSYNFHYIILDESQVIKNPASMLYKTVTKLRSEFKLVLTGTPVENSLMDLWTQLNFVNPGLLGDLSFFRKEYAKPIEKQGDDDKEMKLRKIIKPFILRRTKEMVARDLPPITEQTVYCDMTDGQERLYEEEKSSVRNSILKSVSSATEKSAIVILQGLMKLRQISNHPLLAFEENESGSGKFETVLQDMESVISEGHKILVFSSFVKHLELYAEELKKKRILFSMLTGASTNREKIVNGFQNDLNNKIFLISLRAGGVGLNLTAADYVFILDPWWNPATEMQALNRAHRIGQDKSVFVYRYITSNSIEEKIVRLQEKKSRLADTFIASNNPLKDINVEEILNIIG